MTKKEELKKEFYEFILTHTGIESVDCVEIVGWLLSQMDKALAEQRKSIRGEIESMRSNGQDIMMSGLRMNKAGTGGWDQAIENMLNRPSLSEGPSGSIIEYN